MRTKLVAWGLALGVAVLLTSNPVVVSAAALVTGKQIKDGSVTTKDIKDGSLLGTDFKAGQLPAVAQGLTGSQGPKGDTGAPGQPGTLATTPINVRYTATRSSSHDVAALGGMTLSLECGSNRIGATNVDIVLFSADEVHGPIVKTLYNGSSTVSTNTEMIDASNATVAPTSQTSSGGTHATINAQWIVAKGGVVYTLAMYATRDTRQNRPVCEFIGSLTQQGSVTVDPS